MTTLQKALEALRPELHNALRRFSRKAYGLRFSDSYYALATVAGSTASWRPVGDSVWQTVTPPPEEEGTAGVVRYNLPLWGSKLGGYGLLPRGTAYPVGSEGQPLQLVAQVNFGELWAAAAERDDHFEVPTEYPSRGVLAFYADPFDDLYGCEFNDPEARDGFKVLFFDEEIQPVEALLEAYKGGAMDATALESEVEDLLWTREEQHDIFEQYYYYRLFRKKVRTRYVYFSDSITDKSERDRLREEMRRDLWKLPEDGEKLPEGVKSDAWVKRPTLWYGDVANIRHEYSITFGGVMDMVPHRSVELDEVVIAALKEDPSLVEKDWVKEACKYVSFGYLKDGEAVKKSSTPPFRTYLGGYPDFAQDDPRPSAIVSDMVTALESGKSVEAAEEEALAPLRADSKCKGFQLLWQFESESGMMWGDCGVCNLFIRPEDLAERRFDRVFYNWDCS